MQRALFAVYGLVLSGCASMDETKHVWPTLRGAAPIVIAHRGASGYLPEHTLEAYALAIDHGADVIEPDLVFTKDRVLVARHERFLSGTTDIAAHPEFAARKRADQFATRSEGDQRTDWWVEDFTLAEIKTLRARQQREGRPKEFDGKFEIPTFAEVLSLADRKARQSGRPVGVYPETKHPDYFAAIGMDFAAPLLGALDAYDAGPVYIQSFHPEILKRLKNKTKATLVQLVEDVGGAPSVPLDDIARYAGGVGPQKSLVSSSFLMKAHALGLVVHPWTYRLDAPPTGGFPPDSAEYGTDGIGEMAAAFARGVDGVFTDFPDAGAIARSRAADRQRQRP